MDGAGHQFLTRATLPEDQDGGVRRGDFGNVLIDLGNLLTLTNDTALGPQFGAEPPGLLLQPFGAPGFFQRVGGQVGNGCHHVYVMVVEAAALIVSRKIDDAERLSIGDQRDDERRLRRSAVGEKHRTTFISRLLDGQAFNLNGAVRRRLPKLDRFFGQLISLAYETKKNSSFGGNDLKNGVEQLQRERAGLADGIDRPADLQQFVQVAGERSGRRQRGFYFRRIQVENVFRPALGGCADGRGGVTEAHESRRL